MADKSENDRSIKSFEKLKKRAEALLKDPDAAMKVVDDAARKASRDGKRLEGVKNDFLNLIQMLRAYFRGDYKKLPWTTIISALAAVLYFLNPFDVIPDFILGFGMLDDATVIAFCLRSIKQDLDKFTAQKDPKKEEKITQS
jgi:uncharacterized membrane protein YkvA (DUF1232 family)